MAIEDIDEFISQAPPTKRVRLDNDSSNKTKFSTPIDDMEGIYDREEKRTISASASEAQALGNSPAPTPTTGPFQIPGLGRLGDAPTPVVNAVEVLGDLGDGEGLSEVSGGVIGYPATATAEDSVDRVDVEMAEASTELSPDTNHTDQVIRTGSGEEANTEMSGMPIQDQIEQRITSEAAVVSEEKSGEMEIEDAELALQRASVPPKTSVTENQLQSNTLGESPSNQPVTHALEALLGGLDSPATTTIVSENQPAAEEPPTGDDHPEWEVDSSPIESSSDDSSSDDSSSEEDSDEDNAYKLLSPEEQARILMEGDGGSDDEGANKGAKGAGGQLRTKNEIPEEVIPKPDVIITPEMPIEELGAVEGIVESILLVKAKVSGEYRVLESGSVLCLADRSVIGVVAETLGRVQQPLYTVRFTNAGEITEAGLSVGTKVFYSERHSTYALTQALKAFKGSDASNLHDEEVGDEEIEFSDDEAEMEHKRRLKQKKLERRGGKMQQNGGPSRGGGGHPLQQQHDAIGLSYDDAEDDGPYKPLARPTGFADNVGRSEAPQEGAYTPGGMPNRGGRGDHNRDFRGRGRGDRGRGRGDRGRGRGGSQDRRENSAYSQPPQGRPNGSYAPPMHNPAAGIPQSLQGHQGPPGPPSNNFYRPQNDQYSPQQPQMWPQFPQPPFQQTFQQGFQNMPNGWQNMPPPPPLPSGAFINPAFFSGHQPGAPNQWNQQGSQGQQGGRGGGPPS